MSVQKVTLQVEMQGNCIDPNKNVFIQMIQLLEFAKEQLNSIGFVICCTYWREAIYLNQPPCISLFCMQEVKALARLCHVQAIETSSIIYIFC